MRTATYSPREAGGGRLPERNRRWVDPWSLTHIAWGAAAGYLLGPWWGFLLMAAWEPIEIFVLSPLLARFGVTFGHEGWQNSVGDLGFNAVGVAVGVLVLRPLFG